MALQMAARSVLAGVTIWAFSTLLLVWFWVRHYLPLGPQHFKVWLFSWLFSEVIPLHFLNVPYNGQRYPILSVYLFLSDKIYYHSFPVWFWHYAGWGTIPALLALAIAAYVFAPAAVGGEGEHIRGVTIITARRLGWQLRGDGLQLGGVQLPRAFESQHIAVTGKSGAGKSNLIRGILRQIAARQEAGIVLDPDREYLSEFYRPERGDVVLNPLDERCPLWTPWLELRPGYAEPDAEAQAESLFPDPPRQADVGSTPFFRRSSRMLYLSLLNIAEPREPAALVELLNLPRAELKQRLEGTPAEALIDPGAHEQGAGIVATVANAVNPFRYLPTDAATEWSAREWVEIRTGWVFLTCEEATRAAVLPLLSLWLDSMVHRLLSTELERGARERVWIVADELPVLRRQQKIESLLARGRKRGLCVVIGFQAMPQLRAIYGHDEAATLLSCPTTKAILRTDEPETAEWCSRQIGAREVVHEQIGTSTGPRELRDGFTMQPRRGMEPAVTVGEIQKLPPLTGYLCVTGYDRAKVVFPYLQPIHRQPDFIARSPGNPSASSAKECSAAGVATNGGADHKNVGQTMNGKSAERLQSPPQLAGGKWV
jgi:type IV secretory pathway TraG/TraD family ATPase VirD4